ncbi:DMT family transporter [Rhizobium sp. TH2]|uniref:DMT family transporter n=1 Tax=Rhizobium sp. TH2 TaxID=2775403 RepID=UPI00215881B3|nr:DMT family transporter [Rhizobium sp. TH2]UVC06895.1 DMT family transporter [Rhizobium sp. TH2]
MSSPSSQTISASAWVLLIALGLLWGGSFFFAGIAVRHIPPITLALARFVLAAAALHVFVAGRFGIYRALRQRWRAFLLLGLLNNAIPHALIFTGQTEIGAGLASILNATTPIWTVVIAHFLTIDEKLTGRKIAGTITGLAGVVILFSPQLGASAKAPLWAMALPVLAALSYGFAAIWGRRFRDIAAPVTAAGQMTASTVIMLPVALIHDQPWTLAAPPAYVMVAVLAMALLSTALAYIIYFRLIATAGATNASLVTLLVPPSAILLSFLFLGERLGPEDWTGMAMIGLGLAILDGRLVARIRKLGPG